MQQEKKYKEILARWFRDLDLRETADFKDALEESETENRMEVNLREHIFYRSAPSIKRITFPFWLRGIAASLLIAGFIALGAFIGGQFRLEKSDVFYEAVTRAGERKILTLRDGTRIFLNNSSKIRYARNYRGNNRTVFLDGEAYFDVTHNKQKPFVVTAGKLKIHVLGTSFNINAYRSDLKIGVTVSSGKVGVVENGKTKAWMLIPGDQLNYNKATAEISKRTVKFADFTGWTIGKLVFSNERMDFICTQLSRTYGVHFNILKPQINSRRINLKIDNEDIGTIVKMLGLTGGFHYSIEGREIKIW